MTNTGFCIPQIYQIILTTASIGRELRNKKTLTFARTANIPILWSMHSSLNQDMRKLILSAILLSFLYSDGQLIHSNNWHGGFGLSGGTLNFKQNASVGFAIPLRYSLIQFHNSSISLGTSLKIGAEDKYGIAFPVVLAYLVASGLSGGAAPDPSDIDISKTVRFYTSFPLLLNYNFGLGARNWSNERFGFYLGGGMSYTITGFTNSDGVQQSAFFLGLVANAGIRLGEGTELGLSLTLPLPAGQAIGPINNPFFYEFSLTFSGKR
jgi:hypothetical protein